MRFILLRNGWRTHSMLDTVTTLFRGYHTTLTHQRPIHTRLHTHHKSLHRQA